MFERKVSKSGNGIQPDTTTTRITRAVAADPSPTGPRWTWYSRIAAVAGCSSQSVYLWHRRQGFRPVVRLSAFCRACGGRLVGGAHGFCRACCVAWGRSWC